MRALILILAVLPLLATQAHAEEAVRTYLKVADRIEGATDALEQALAPFQKEARDAAD